jgi:hypothetical protein
VILWFLSVQAATLDAPVDLFGDQPTEVVVHDADPGTTWGLAVGLATAPGATCPPTTACLDLRSPQLLGVATADATGRVAWILRPPEDRTGRAWLQAAELGGSDTTAALAVDLWPADVDRDGDGLPDVTELRLGLDPLASDTDGDGQADADDPAPLDPAVLDAWTPADTVVSDPTSSLRDPEFDGLRMAWQEEDGSAVWLAEVDPVSGALLPTDGRGTLLATGAAPIDLAPNGPEWVRTDAGAEIVLSRQDPGGAVLARIRQTPSGWSMQDLPGTTVGSGPFGSQDAGDPDARVFFKTPVGTPGGLHWRPLDDPARGGSLGLLRRDSAWVPGTRQVAGVAPDAAGVAQVVLVSVDTGARDVVTAASTTARMPRCWEEPSDAGAIWCAAVHAAAYGEELRVYASTAGWAHVHTVRTPAGWPWLMSPEVFVHGGQSWVVLVGQAAPGPGEAGHVYLASLTAAAPIRRVSGRRRVVRRDPEVVLAGATPWAFYVEVDGVRVLHRAELGL